jgi:hypothetical protein
MLLPPELRLNQADPIGWEQSVSHPARLLDALLLLSGEVIAPCCSLRREGWHASGGHWPREDEIRSTSVATTQRIGWGLVGAGTTMLARAATRRALIDEAGGPRLPHAARRNHSFTMMVALAAVAGALLAVGDVLQKQRKQVARAPQV